MGQVGQVVGGPVGLAGRKEPAGRTLSAFTWVESCCSQHGSSPYEGHKACLQVLVSQLAGAPLHPACPPRTRRPQRPRTPVGKLGQRHSEGGTYGDRVLLQLRSSEQSTKADAHRELIKTLKELKVHLPADRKPKGKASTLATLKYALRSVKQVKGRCLFQPVAVSLRSPQIRA